MLRLAMASTAAILTLASLPAQASAPAQAGYAELKAVVAAPDRDAANKARDGARHPVETLTFWGLKPKQTVIELSPGGGYWTEILAPYAKATGGTYVATAADLANPNISEGAKKARAAFEAKYADTARYGSIRYVGFGPVSGPLGPAGSADIVITARNIHNWMMNKTLDKVLSELKFDTALNDHPADRQKLRQLVQKHLDAFAANDEDIGSVQLIEHHIETGDAAPARARARFYSPTQRLAIKAEVDKYKTAGIVRPSSSPWAAPVLIVK